MSIFTYFWEQKAHHCGTPCCDPGRIRQRIYHTPELVSWATNYLLERLHQMASRDDVIRERRAAGEKVIDLAKEYGLSPARISQIIQRKR